MSDLSTTAPFVAAMGRGLSILQAFANADEWLGNSEIALRSGLPKSTVSRATSTLTQIHFLDEEPGGQRFRLGAAVLELAGRVTSFESLSRVMRPELQALAIGSGGSTGAAYLSNGGLCYFEYCRSDAAVGLSLQRGSVVSVFKSAVGRAYLAAATEGERARLFDRADAHGVSPADLKQQWQDASLEYQADGFCRAYGTWKKEVNTIAVPYRVPCSGLLIAVSLAGPVFSLAAESLDNVFSPKLKATLDAIDRQFGRESKPE